MYTDYSANFIKPDMESKLNEHKVCIANTVLSYPNLCEDTTLPNSNLVFFFFFLL